MTDSVNKQYLDYAGLVEYDSKIKSLINTNDATTLASAKSYADGLAVNYDAAGSAATALKDAKTYADGKDAAIQAAQAQADKGVADAGKAQAAADKAQAAADKAQGEVDALESYVGTFTASEGVDTVVKYIDKKTDGIASNEALVALATRVTTAEGAIDAIEADYLKAEHKTALENSIAQEAKRAAEAEGALSDRLDEVETFFELTGEEKLDEALDTLVEIQKYITTEGAAADQMVLDIAANAKAIADEIARATKAEGDIETAYKAADEQLAGDIAALEAKFGEGEGSVSDMIADAVAAEAALRVKGDQDAEASAAAALKAGQDAQKEVDALEIVVETLTQTVSTKATKDELNTLAGRVTDNETAIANIDNHSHANKAVIDGITAELVAQWNEAYGKRHEHANKEALDSITASKIALWDAAESNAKSYTDSEIAKFVPITITAIDGLFTTASA